MSSQNQNWWEVWVLGIWPCSTILYWQNKLGGYCIIQTLCFIWFLNHFFFSPKFSILEARGSRSGSYAWTSILKGRDVIRRGSRWRIRNGKSVKIWQNHWLLKKHPPLVFSPTLSSMEDAAVDILIDALKRQWNHGLIDGILSPQEANLIKKIPLARGESDDSIFWPLAKDGC